jgi:hypothetical protein
MFPSPTSTITYHRRKPPGYWKYQNPMMAFSSKKTVCQIFKLFYSEALAPIITLKTEATSFLQRLENLTTIHSRNPK